jgi:hypothetical protein
VLRLLVDVQGAFPAAEDEHGKEEPRGEAAAPADAADVEQSPGVRIPTIAITSMRSEMPVAMATSVKVLPVPR